MFSRKPHETFTYMWDYLPNEMKCEVVTNANMNKPQHAIHAAPARVCQPLWSQTTNHHLLLTPNPGWEEADYPSGKVVYEMITKGYDKYQKQMKNADGTKSDGTYMETKKYSGTFGLTSNTNMFDLQLILHDDETAEEHNVLFKCTHHPISNKQWPAIDNPDAVDLEEGETGFEGIHKNL